MTTIQIGKNEYSAPGNFEELSQEQFLYFCQLYSNKLEKDEILKRVAFRWTNWPMSEFAKLSKLHIVQYADSFSWLFSEFFTRKNLIPYFTIDGVKYLGYSDNLEDLMVDEWECGDPEAIRFNKTKDESALLNLVSFYYRPVSDDKSSGEQRESFNEKRCKYLAVKLKGKLPLKYQYAILINYAALRLSTVQDYKTIFQANPSGPDFGIPAILDAMSSGDIASFDLIKKTWTMRNLLFMGHMREVKRKTNSTKPVNENS